GSISKRNGPSSSSTCRPVKPMNSPVSRRSTANSPKPLSSISFCISTASFSETWADRTFGKYLLTSLSMFILTNSGMSLCFQSLIISLFVLIYFMTISATLYCILLIPSPLQIKMKEKEETTLLLFHLAAFVLFWRVHPLVGHQLHFNPVFFKVVILNAAFLIRSKHYIHEVV